MEDKDRELITQGFHNMAEQLRLRDTTFNALERTVDRIADKLDNIKETVNKLEDGVEKADTTRLTMRLETVEKCATDLVTKYDRIVYAIITIFIGLLIFLAKFIFEKVTTHG